jgi:hypothetical protein
MKNVIDVVIANLEEAASLRRDAITKGSVVSYEEYKFLTGVIAGLQGAIDALKDANKRYTEE